ncbi:MAG: hypothetical protein P8L23_00725 [Flavobacteriales bacterium]|nr:hypothetical protein [Flavobacteriales bacterium]
MRSVKFLLFIALISSLSYSCNKSLFSNKVKTTGLIQKQGITTYMYGTHTITDYALKSNSINLDNYIDKNVSIIGEKIDGYPVDGGPDYIEVKKIKVTVKK